MTEGKYKKISKNYKKRELRQCIDCLKYRSVRKDMPSIRCYSCSAKLRMKNITIETRKKMGLSAIGNKRGLGKHWKIKDTTKWKNKKVLEKTKEKLRSFTKEKRYNYIKDRTKLKKSEKKHLDYAYKNWMIEIKKRDNWKCKLLNNDCSGRLESHHIFNWIDYPELRYVLTNGITLCAFHHPRGREEEKRMIPIFQELVSKEIF